MKIKPNDPKWTAYALGEVTDEMERAEIERLLEESEEMRRLVEDIRQTAGLLAQELSAEPCLNLTPGQRARIKAKADSGQSWLGLRPAWVLAGATVMVVLASALVISKLWRTNAIPQEQLAAIENIRKNSAGDPRSASYSQAKPSSPETAEKSALNRKPDPGAPASSGAQIAGVISPAPPQIGSLDEKAKAATAINGLTKQSQSAVRQNDLNTVVEVTAGAPALNTEAAQVVSPVMSTSFPTGQKVAGPTSYMLVAPSPPGQRWMPPPPPRPRHDPWLPIQRKPGDFNTEAYNRISDNPFLDVAQNPLSTFSIDVDSASYSNMRRFLESGSLPPKDSIRIEELVNYFDYDYKGPQNDKPFAANFEITEAPWKPEHRLLRLGLKAREIPQGKRPAANLVFLLDISGSMAATNKLPLVKESMRLLVDQLTESDRVAIVVYASDTSVLLPSTSGDQKEKIRQAIDRLNAGGSTNGASGIQLAYQAAKENFIQGGINRVILATDGDFNVGITNQGDLTRLIEDKAKSGTYLSALGFGMGNYKDSTLELLANKGHGNYAYIDTLNEAKKVLVEQMNGTLVPIAKDVKIQVEFNPRRVSAYRLIGYEDRLMPKEDFNDDTKDAGVIGAGHAVTALYELVPVGLSMPKPGVDPLKYQKPPQPSASADSSELLTIKIRSKEPEKDTSVLSEFAVKDSEGKFSKASQDFKFAAAVAAFGMVLRDSPHKGDANMEHALEWAKEGKGPDSHGYRAEFIRLIHRAISISF
jgi:Ca-activated chloride channel homolog